LRTRVEREGQTIANSHRTIHVNKLKKIIEATLDADKASDISTIDLAGKSSLADYMIVATGLSHKHLAAIADHIVDQLHALGVAQIPVEGKPPADWIVVDAGNIIIHLFRQDARNLYNLEKMWAMPAIAEAVM
jgi:ribosome-associated protein